MQGHPKQAEVEADLMATYAKRPSLAMVDSNKVGKILISLKGSVSQEIVACAAERSPLEFIFLEIIMEKLCEKFKSLQQVTYIYAWRKKFKEKLYIRLACSNRIVLTE